MPPVTHGGVWHGRYFHFTSLGAADRLGRGYWGGGPGGAAGKAVRSGVREAEGIKPFQPRQATTTIHREVAAGDETYAEIAQPQKS
jgi:hypothetical protein